MSEHDDEELAFWVEEDDVFAYEDTMLGDDDEGDFALSSSGDEIETLTDELREQILEVSPNAKSSLDKNAQIESQIVDNMCALESAWNDYSIVLSEYEFLTTDKFLYEESVAIDEETELLDGEIDNDSDLSNYHGDEHMDRVRQKASSAYDKWDKLSSQQDELYQKRRTVLLTLIAKMITNRAPDSLLRQLSALVGLSGEQDTKTDHSLVSAKPQKAVIYTSISKQLGDEDE